ncbi:hypothetical protein [Nitrosomonas sp. Nm166]|uniref:hypothetical protein n=1 Tax=Nitrosomonas sp. Nm166 TaxID=1881054 RepID=UPI0008E3FD55|nr:hypothetical protein [Nitrosomonas sp. Nm166]SFF12650.1 hypothetical protein SAMN05428977_105316 [Nitrosomonas sp. Nm166]
MNQITGYDLLSENHKREFNRLKALQTEQIKLSATGSRKRVFTRQHQVMMNKYFEMMGYLFQTRKLS